MGVLEAGAETIVKINLLNKYSDDKFVIQSIVAEDDFSAVDVVGLWMLYLIFLNLLIIQVESSKRKGRFQHKVCLQFFWAL